MPEPSDVIPHRGPLAKAEAVLAAVRAGERDVAAIAKLSGVRPATVVRVAALLRDMHQIDRLHRRGPLVLLPIFQRSNVGSRIMDRQPE